MKLGVLGVAASWLTASLAMGQWATDPSATLRVADRSGEQAQPKIRPTADGGCYVAWFDNAVGGYDVYLQRLDAQGVEQWPHNGVLLRDRGVSSNTDWDMVVDGLGNAIVAYADDTAPPGGAQQVTISKVTPSGTILWTTFATSGTVSKASPQLCILADGSIIMGCSNFASPGNWIMQKLDAGGAVQWGSAGITYSEAGHYLGFCDIQAAGNDFIALWLRSATTSPLGTKLLWAQKFDANGTALWNAGTPVAVSGATTGLGNGYQPPFLPDGAGGAVFGWYEGGASRNAYIQHVLADGSLKWSAPIANTGPSAPTTRIRVGAGLAYDAGTGEYYLASAETNSSTQSINSTFVQKFDAAGTRLWGDIGVTLEPQGSPQQSFVQCQPQPDGCVVLYMNTVTATTRVIRAAKVLSEDQSVPWSIFVNNDSSTDKSRLTSALATDGGVLASFGWGATGDADIAAQRLNRDGTLGPPAGCRVACDYNDDGGADNSDVVDLADAVASGTDPYPTHCKDFNNDGGADNADVIDLADAIASGSCG